MVHVKKDYNNPPAKFIDSKWDAIKQDVLTNSNHKANSKCYRDATLTELVKLYSNKCACCERSRGEELQIDHYRPKKARKNKDTTYNHSGYYWLTYEWSNLIPLCSSCNQAKSNYFPLQNKRITSHTHQYANQPIRLYIYEKPLFINPEIDTKPERHFKYLPNGTVEGRTIEGETMVNLYKLNSRTKRRERREIIKNYILDFRKALYRYYNAHQNNEYLRGSLDTIFDRIIENGKSEKPLSLMHDYIRRFFGNFIENHFKPNMHNKLITLFNEYQNKWSI